MLKSLKTTFLIVAFCLLCLPASAVLGRTWTDASGRFQVEANLIAINDDVVVLKSKQGNLIAVQIAQLSEADQSYLRSEQSGSAKLGDKDKDHVWNVSGDLKFIGRVVDYFQQDLVLERLNARLMLNGKEEKEIPEMTLKILPLIVEHFEQAKINDLPSLRSWLTSQGKVPHTYSIEGVVIALSSGEEVKVPIFLLGSAERVALEPGLNRWRSLKGEKLEDAERTRLARQQALWLSSSARAYQMDKAAEAQARMLQLDLLAIDAGITDLWEVLLVPPNPYAYPFTVLVPARDSASAQIVAQQKYPTYTVDVTRKLSAY